MPRAKSTEREIELKWVAPPKQARSQERLERLLNAAETVIAERGFEQASVADIMARAGSSVGIFYQRFKTKDDLLRCLLARFTEESIATTDVVLAEEAWRGKSIAAIIRRVVPFLVVVYRARRGLLRAILLQASVDPLFTQEAHLAEEHVADKLEKLLLDRAREIRHPNPRAAASLAYQMLRSTLNTLILFELKTRAGLSLDDPELEGELARAFLLLLGIREPTRASNGKPRKTTARTRRKTKVSS